MTEKTASTPSIIKTSVLPNSPFPTRILKMIRDEEEWLSGSELKTDNSSSSDDEMSPTSQNLNKKFNKTKKRRKSKVSFKDAVEEKKCDDNISTTTESLKSDDVNGGKILRGSTDEKSTSLLFTSIAESDEDDSEIYWRPKRGSISLPGLVNEINKTSISDTK